MKKNTKYLIFGVIAICLIIFGGKIIFPEEALMGVITPEQVAQMLPIYRCYHSSAYDHMISIDPNCEIPSYGTGALMGWIFTAPPEETVPIYRCWHDPKGILDIDHMMSIDPNCEAPGYTGVLMGYIHSQPKLGTVPIYRCVAFVADKLDHMLSFDPYCERGEYGQEGIFGYIFLTKEAAQASQAASTFTYFRYDRDSNNCTEMKLTQAEITADDYQTLEACQLEIVVTVTQTGIPITAGQLATGVTGVSPLTYYRYNSDTNDCTSVQLYTYEVTGNDYAALDECEDQKIPTVGGIEFGWPILLIVAAVALFMGFKGKLGKLGKTPVLRYLLMALMAGIIFAFEIIPEIKVIEISSLSISVGAVAVIALGALIGEQIAEKFKF